MLSVVIPTLNAEKSLAATLAALVPGVVDGLVREVIISDGGSTDATLAIADEAGCTVVSGPAGRGGQLARGAAAARGGWLMFLHGDTVLETDWQREMAGFLARHVGGGTIEPPAAAFRYRLDDQGPAPRLLERIVALRVSLLALPYGDQGLVIARPFYDRLGGYADLPLMEDVDLMRRIGRRRLRILDHHAVTGAERYRREGYLRRMARNALCLTLYFAGVAPDRIVRIYR